MRIEFDDQNLDALETDLANTLGLSQAIVKAYRRRVAQIRAAKDERDLYAIKSLKLEKLQGQRKDEHSLRLNDQFRLIIRIEGQRQDKLIRIISIEDYH